MKTWRRLAPAALVAAGAVLAIVDALFVPWASWYFTTPGYERWISIDGLEDCNDVVPPGIADGWQALVLGVLSLVAAALLASVASRRRGAVTASLGVALIATASFSALAAGSTGCDWLNDSDVRLGPGVPLLAAAGGLVLAGGIIAAVRREVPSRTRGVETHPLVRAMGFSLLGLAGTSAVAAVALKSQGTVYTYMGLATLVYAAKIVGPVAGLCGAAVLWYRGSVTVDRRARRLALTLAIVCVVAGLLPLLLLGGQPAVYDD